MSLAFSAVSRLILLAKRTSASALKSIKCEAIIQHSRFNISPNFGWAIEKRLVYDRTKGYQEETGACEKYVWLQNFLTN